MSDPATEVTRATPPGRPSTGQAGDLVDGRYRLTHLEAVGVTALWRADDEVLARTVAVRLLADADGGTRAAFIRAAARAGSVAGDGVVSVLDAATEAPAAAQRDGRDRPLTYVVAEWVDGRTLAQAVRSGPLGVDEVVRMVRDLCDTLEQAHARGVVSGRLHAGQVVLPDVGGRPRLADLETAAAAHEPTLWRSDGRPGDLDASADQVREDTRGLVRLLYAGLTGTWPDAGSTRGWTGLPPAPRRDGRLRLPGELRDGIPRQLDLVVARTLDPVRRPDDPAITTPAQLRGALAALPTSSSEEESAEVPATRRRRARPHVGRRRLLLIALPVWIVLLAVGGWALGQVLGRVPGADATRPSSLRPSPTSGAAGATTPPLTLASVSSFDPLGDGRENEDQVPLATDGVDTTVWMTESYNSASFGGLKSGVGLLVDLGTPRSVSDVDILAPAGERVELLAAPSAQQAPTSINGLPTVAGPVTAQDGQSVALTPSSRAPSRWYVVWIVGLPPSASPGAASNAFSGGIAEMTFHG